MDRMVLLLMRGRGCNADGAACACFILLVAIGLSLRTRLKSKSVTLLRHRGLFRSSEDEEGGRGAQGEINHRTTQFAFQNGIKRFFIFSRS